MNTFEYDNTPFDRERPMPGRDDRHHRDHHAHPHGGHRPDHPFESERRGRSGRGEGFGPGDNDNRGRRGPRMGFGPGFGPGDDNRGRRGGRGQGGPRGEGFGFPGAFGEDMPAGFVGGPGRGRGGRPGRGRRGDVRAAIIALLGEEPMNGYQLINAISEKSSGLWSPSAGSVYPALGLLEDEGLIAPTEGDGKKLFRLTDAGKAYAEEHADQVTAPWDRVAGPHKAVLGLRPELHQLGAAVQQLAMTGDEAQTEAAREVLVKARQNIYRLLAGDTPQD